MIGLLYFVTNSPIKGYFEIQLSKLDEEEHANYFVHFEDGYLYWGPTTSLLEVLIDARDYVQHAQFNLL